MQAAVVWQLKRKFSRYKPGFRFVLLSGRSHRRGLWNRQADHDHGASSVMSGFDFEASAQLPNAFAHPPDPNSNCTAGDHLCPLILGYAFALILYLHANRLFRASKPDLGDRTSGVAMDVSQAFLDNTEDGCLQLSGQSAEVIGQVKIDFNPAAFYKSLNKPAESRG